MSGSDRLQADPLFQGLARPVMIAGVSYMYFVINAMLTMVVFINSKNFVMLLLIGPLIHGVGVLICRSEPRAVEFFILKASSGSKSWNNLLGYHNNTNSYDVF